jgi:hypothetical protein
VSRLAEGERELWCEVVHQAWLDLFATKPSTVREIRDWEQDQREARLFLLMRGGKWARSREIICDVVGLDPDALRERAEKELKRIKNSQEGSNG